MPDPAPEPRPQVMPVFVGAPWGPKFRGPNSDVSLKDWTAQTKYLADLQGLTEPQRLQFLLGSLEGEARREVLAAAEAKRNTSKAVLDYLKELYGDKTPTANLRAQFFNCRQAPRQSIRAFALQLRELLARLKNREDHGLGEEDTLMRDQFLLGLRDGPIRQCLKSQLRRTATLTYEDLRKEALELELDQQETDEPPASVAASCTCAPAPPAASDWKRELHMEIMKDVKEQMAELSKTLLEEMRRNRPSLLPPPRGRSYSEGTKERRPTRPNGPRFQWDDEGRPICNRCGAVGHMSRDCTARRPSQPDF